MKSKSLILFCHLEIKQHFYSKNKTTRGVRRYLKSCSIDRIGRRALDLYGLNFFHLASEFQNINPKESMHNNDHNLVHHFLHTVCIQLASAIRFRRAHRLIKLFRHVRTSPMKFLDVKNMIFITSMNEHEDYRR